MSEEMVTITVDGKEVRVPKGMLLVEATKAANVEVPVFCYHPKLDPAGVCRMCLVEVEGQRKPVTACTMPVSDGMVVKTDTPLVQSLQKGVIEFLLLNHPLDCPVCDKGGECPLQDNTFRWGASASRSLDVKDRRRKAVDLGQFIVLDEERCILCRRCVRFDDEISQEKNLVVGERSHLAMITTANGESFDSYFSGNTIELCPVGALTSDLYRFKSRPWDLSRVPAVCTGCSVGCNVFLDYRFGNLLRVISRENPELDGGWLCDRGRFNYGYVHAPERIESPLIRKGDEFHPVSWEEALAEIALKMRTIKRDHGGEAIGAIGGGRLTNEEAYLFQKLVRTALGSPHVDWRTGEQYVAAAPEFPGKIADISRASGILLVDVLPAERAPVIDLRIRRAAERGKATLAAVGPAMPKYRPECREFPALPDEMAATLRSDELHALFAGKERVVVLWSGRDDRVGDALRALLRRWEEAGTQVHLLIPGEQANAVGAERHGVHPEYLPGLRPVADNAARAEVERAWQTELPAGEGLSTHEMLEKAAAGELEALYLVSANLLGTYPDRALAEAALRRIPFLVVHEMFMTETAQMADVILPVASFPEKSGTYTACDGTEQVVERSMRGYGQSRSDGDALAAVAEAMGLRLYASDQELRWELQQLAPPTDAAEGQAQSSPQVAGLTRRAHWGPRVATSEGDAAAAGEDALTVIPVERLYAGGGTAYFDPGLRRARPQAVATLHPDDARRLGVEEGDGLALESAGGSVRFRAEINPAVIKGSVQVPKGLFEAPANALGHGAQVRVEKAVVQEVS